MQSLRPATLRDAPIELSCALNRSSTGSLASFSCLRRCPAWQLRSDAPVEQQHTKTVSAVSSESEVALKEGAAGKFNWFKNWWPIQAVDNLLTDRPYRVQLLGKYYVVWKGHSGEWIALDDECPHRLAPLSEGRIEDDGNLLCSYHAWRFDETGKCVKIPHAEDEKAQFIACNSPRSAVQTYPCKSRGAMLWIWPDKASTNFEDSKNAFLPIDDDIADYFERVADQGILDLYVRYLPYSFDILLENLCDPAHFTVSHHGAFSSLSRYDAQPLYARLAEPINKAPESVGLSYVPEKPFAKWIQYDLKKPGTVYIYSGDSKDEIREAIYLAATPVSRGKSLILTASATRNQMDETAEPNMIERAVKKLTRTISHVKFTSAIFDGDSVFLYEQDKKVRKHGSNFAASKKYYIPTSTDLLIMDFRKWFETEGEHGEAYGGNEQLEIDSELTREEMLDRYEQHTKHCKVCRESLELIQHFCHVLKILSVGALFIGSMILIRATSRTVFEFKVALKSIALWTVIVVGLASVFVQCLIEKKIIPLFYFKDWVHADKD